MSINFVPTYMNPDMTHHALSQESEGAVERTAFMKPVDSSFNFVPKYLDPRTMQFGITSCESLASELEYVAPGELQQYPLIRTYSTEHSESAISPEGEINPELAGINQTPERAGRVFAKTIAEVEASRALFSPPFQFILNEMDKKDREADSGLRGRSSSIARYIESFKHEKPGIPDVTEEVSTPELDAFGYPITAGSADEAFNEEEPPLYSEVLELKQRLETVLNRPEQQAMGAVSDVLIRYESVREHYEAHYPEDVYNMDQVVGLFSTRPEHIRGLTPFERPLVRDFLDRYEEIPPE